MHDTFSIHFRNGELIVRDQVGIKRFVHSDLIEKLLVLVLKSLDHVNMFFFNFLNFAI